MDGSVKFDGSTEFAGDAAVDEMEDTEASQHGRELLFFCPDVTDATTLYKAQKNSCTSWNASAPSAHSQARA